jgi:hypothetical protein
MLHHGLAHDMRHAARGICDTLWTGDAVSSHRHIGWASRPAKNAEWL